MPPRHGAGRRHDRPKGGAVNVREELIEVLLPVYGYPAPGEAEAVNALVDAYRAEVLREALAAISGEQLSDRTGTPEDEAYSGGISDAHRAVMALIYP